MGVRFPAGKVGIFLLYRAQVGTGAHPTSSPERETDHSHLPCAKMKNAWSYTFIPPIRLHGVVLVTHRDKFTFTLVSSHMKIQALIVLSCSCLCLSLLTFQLTDGFSLNPVWTPYH
jgi:hypothetical protein